VTGTCGLRIIGYNDGMNLLPRQYMIHVNWIKIFIHMCEKGYMWVSHVKRNSIDRVT